MMMGHDDMLCLSALKIKYDVKNDGIHKSEYY